jgi:Protein of unknown function (DUF2586)
MALNNVSFVLGQGGLGRPLATNDHISGLVLYSSSLPSGFSSSNRIKQFFSVQDAVNAGILNDYSDATAATATYLITTLGGSTDTITITVADPSGTAKTLCAYTKQSGDTTIALMGASIAAAINAGTTTHGYTASFATATLTLTAPKKMGIFLNSGSPITVTIAGTIAGTLTQFSGGVASRLAVYYYHISEYFRLQPNGNLFVGIFAVPGTYDFSEITTMQNFAGGQIRQVGVFKDSAAFAAGDLTLINTQCANNVAAHKELIALYAGDISATATISTLPDLSQQSNNYVTAVIGQDGAGQGYFLYQTFGKSITVLGAALGAVSLSKVNESIAWGQKYNIDNGYECDTLAFANGVLFTSSSVNDSLLSTMNNYRYLFLRKFVGVTGSFFNDNHAATAFTSSYAYISDNRTIQKATRSVYTNMVPALNSPVQLDSDGTLSDQSIAYFTNLATEGLITMARNGEISAYKAVVSGAQNVLATNVILVAVAIVPYGTSRNITVNIGFNVTVNG